MSIKKEIEAGAIAAFKCPTCGAGPGKRCRNTVADDKGRHVPVKTHRRRLSKMQFGHLVVAAKTAKPV